MKSAIFLDRDGVIIENQPNYVRSWQDVVIFDQAVQALVRLKPTAYKIVIITNQSAVGRGMMSLATAHSINTKLISIIEHAGGRVDGVFLCPHAPDEYCSCRKPLPGLILQAAEQLSIDLETSWMVGDAVSDLQAGTAAGIPNLALVLTGRGRAQIALPDAENLQPFRTYQELAELVDDLIKQPS